jgi:hypothetical protein
MSSIQIGTIRKAVFVLILGIGLQATDVIAFDDPPSCPAAECVSCGSEGRTTACWGAYTFAGCTDFGCTKELACTRAGGGLFSLCYCPPCAE